MNDPTSQSLDQLEQQYDGQEVSHDRLLELLTSSAFHARTSRGGSLAFHHDLVLALLELKRRRALVPTMAALLTRRDDDPAGPISTSDPRVDDPLELAARDLLSLVQNKEQLMSHPDNVRLTDSGETILVNEVRLLLLQLALPGRRELDGASGRNRGAKAGALDPSGNAGQSTRDVYRDALHAQSASNLGALIHGFDRVITQLQREAAAGDHDTEWINTHPASVLFAEQVYFLSGSGRRYSAAHRECTEKARPASRSEG